MEHKVYHIHELDDNTLYTEADTVTPYTATGAHFKSVAETDFDPIEYNKWLYTKAAEE